VIKLTMSMESPIELRRIFRKLKSTVRVNKYGSFFSSPRQEMQHKSQLSPQGGGERGKVLRGRGRSSSLIGEVLIP